MTLKDLTALYINKMATILKQNDRTKFNRKWINLKDTVSELVSMLSRKLKENEISCHINIPDNLALEFDPHALQQIFLNLIMNSTKMMRLYKQGRTITIEAAEHLEERERTTCVEICYEDDGPGIATEYFLRVFDRGFSLTGGTGLGLSIAKSIVEAHNGTIKVVSKKKQGAKFRIRVPKRYVKKKGVNRA